MLSRASSRGGATSRLAGAKSRLGMGRGGVVAGTTALGYSTWLEPWAIYAAGAAS